jgi:GMP synthase (glutamine-hydrolysing)
MATAADETHLKSARLSTRKMLHSPTPIIVPERRAMLPCGPVSRPTGTSDPILVILHQERSNPGRIGQILIARGYALDVRRPRFGNPLPATMAHHAGAIIFGGPMSANDEEKFIRQEIDWLAVPLSENKPFLGVCLGAQMLVRHLGGKVAYHPQGQVEIGYYPIKPTPAGRALCPAWPRCVYQSHREGIDLPSGSELLAEGETFPVQAFRHGSCYGFQFHPEVTHAMMCQWVVRGAERLALPGAKPWGAHFEDSAVYDVAIRAWLADFLEQWIAGRPNGASEKRAHSTTDGARRGRGRRP